MRFLIDAQLPPALARWIAAQGFDAEHVADLGLEAAKDRVVWNYADRQGGIIISKDEDFAQRRALAAGGPAIVWLRVGNTRRHELLRWFATIFPRALAALERGDTLVEIRGP